MGGCTSRVEETVLQDLEEGGTAAQGVKDISEGTVEVVFGVGEIIDGISDIFRKSVEKIDFANQGVEPGGIKARGIKEIAKGAVEIVSGVGDVVSGISDIFGKSGDKTLDPTRYELQLVEQKVENLKNISERADENVSGSFEGVKEIAEGAVEVVSGVGEIIDGIADIFGILGEEFDFASKKFQNGGVGRGVKEIAKGAVEITKGVGDFVSGIGDLFGGFADESMVSATNRLQLIKKKVGDLRGVKEIVEGAVEVVSGIGDIDDGIKHRFGEFEEGVAVRGIKARGVKEFAEGTVEVVAGVGEIVDGIKDIFGKFVDKTLESTRYSFHLIEKRKRLGATNIKNNLGPFYPLPGISLMPGPVIPVPSSVPGPGPVISGRVFMTYELMKFSGYYKMDHGPDAFLMVDSNMVVVKKVATYDVSLVVSMDGITSTRCAFTGTFDGVLLRQISYDIMGESFCLSFERHDGKNGIVASFSGTISVDGGVAISVFGSTYDNPIPYLTFVGTYHEVVPFGSVSQMSYTINADNCIIVSTGCLIYHIEDFVYNFNTFSFTLSGYSGYSSSDVFVVKLIMGVDFAAGLVCNEETLLLKPLAETMERTFVQILMPEEIVSSKSLNENSSELAKFAGYYQLPSMGTGAFVSITPQYFFLSSGSVCEVFIGISKNGITSKQYKFDKTMTLTSGNTLTMPDQGIEFEFTRAYNAYGVGDLVNLKGSFKDFKNVFGYTCFNPVPLNAFSGVPLTNKNDVLDIKSDNEVVYNGIEMKEIGYNPLTRVAGYPQPTISFYLGTFGTAGVTAMVTDYKVNPPKISYVFAIPP